MGEWERCAGVLDVPPAAVVDVPERGMWIEMGIGLAGRGTVWLDDVKVEEVAKDALVTSVVRDRTAPDNLSFERRSAATRGRWHTRHE